MYVYTFEFNDFERGLFTARQSLNIPGENPNGGDWVCLAGNHSHALELARRAASEEWEQPTGRGPLDFIVKFIPAPIDPSPAQRG